MSPAYLLLPAAALLALMISRRTRSEGWAPGWGLEELTVTSTGLPNNPPARIIPELQRLTRVVLAPLERAVGTRPRVTSGYRSPDVNRAVGGSSSSDHLRGRALDLVVPGLDAEQLAREIHRAGIPYDQLIWYAPSRGGHVHIGVRESNRRQALEAPASGGYRIWRP